MIPIYLAYFPRISHVLGLTTSWQLTNPKCQYSIFNSQKNEVQSDNERNKNPNSKHVTLLVQVKGYSMEMPLEGIIALTW